MGKINRFRNVMQTYVFSRWFSGLSTASFWYIPEPARIVNKKDFDEYCSIGKNKAPYYFMDYNKKLEYSHTNREGIIVLPYGGDIGDQINPEAAFQYALGLHDAYIASGNSEFLTKFLYYADYFLNKQSEEGHWYYYFSNDLIEAPWYSALAQSRGASVMLRAFMHTSKTSFLYSAQKAISRFAMPVEQGGYLCSFEPEDCYYFEEYPQIKNGVINGFMSSLFGIWELKHWIKDKVARDLWDVGILSLQKMLPFYTMYHWSLYDRDPAISTPNFNSPRYHRLEIDYLKVLNTLDPSESLSYYLEKRQAQDTKWGRMRAMEKKLKFKINYR